MYAVLLTSWLSMFAPPADGVAEPERPPAELDPYSQAVATLDAAIPVDPDPESTTEQIQNMVSYLEAVTDHPDQLRGDPDALRLVDRARLELVFLYQLDRNASAEAATMDDAIRSGPARILDLINTKYGPTMLELYHQRRELLEAEGQGFIEVLCGAVPCEVVVNEQPSGLMTDPLFLGTYRVRIGPRDSDSEAEWELHEIELSTPDETVTVEYTAGIVAEQPEGPSETPPPVVDTGPALTQPKRMLPRWAEILGLTAGAAAVATGVVMAIYAGKCHDGRLPTDPAVTMENCPSVYNESNTTTGAVLMGVGGGLFVISGVVLSVDEVRVGRAKGRQAMLTYQFRF